MQIVIDIDDKTYKAFTELISINLGRSTYKGIIEKCLNAIKNGTPLLKGHGKLIDADDLDITTITTDDYSGNEVLDVVLKDDIDDAPTIIEADKGEA